MGLNSSLLVLLRDPINGVALTLALLDSLSSGFVGNLPTDITLKGLEPVLPGAARMTFIVPMGGLNVLDRKSTRLNSSH